VGVCVRAYVRVRTCIYFSGPFEIFGIQNAAAVHVHKSEILLNEIILVVFFSAKMLIPVPLKLRVFFFKFILNTNTVSSVCHV
jgi:hypothetical protein